MVVKKVFPENIHTPLHPPPPPPTEGIVIFWGVGASVRLQHLVDGSEGLKKDSNCEGGIHEY